MILSLVLACSAEDRALLNIPVTFHASEAEASPVDGVDITFTTASITLSDLRLEAPAETASVWDWSLISTAHAHPGHDFAGDVAGELTGTWTLDLLGDDVELGTAACYEGDYATGRLTVLPDPVAVLEGTVTVDGVSLPFRFEEGPDQEITGLDFDPIIDAAQPPAGIDLAVDLGHALSYSDWTAGDTDGDGTLTIADGSFANTVKFGLVSTPTWILTTEP